MRTSPGRWCGRGCGSPGGRRARARSLWRRRRAGRRRLGRRWVVGEPGWAGRRLAAAAASSGATGRVCRACAYRMCVGCAGAGVRMCVGGGATVLGGPARVSREGGSSSSSSSGRGRCWMRRTGATQRGGGRRGGRRQQGSEVVVVVKVSSAARKELRQTLSRRGVLRAWVCRRGGRPLCKAGTRNRQQALAMV